MAEERGKIQGYDIHQKILLVGEGDFSFSVALANAFGNGSNMTATSYLDEETLIQEHPTSKAHLLELRSLGCKLLFGIDVHKMNNHPKLRDIKFDMVIYNFPHVGHVDQPHESSYEMIGKNKNLVHSYFSTASSMIAKGGEVHLRHRVDKPYSHWDVEELASKVGLGLKEKVAFYKSDFPGYENKRGGGVDSNLNFPIKNSATYKFSANQ